MASEPSSQTGDDTNMEIATQDGYVQEAYQSAMVPLKRGSGAFEVREVPPLQLIRDAKTYGVLELLGGDQDADVADMIESGRFENFVKEAMLPNIVRPYCYWERENVADHVIPQLSDDDRDRLSNLLGVDPRNLDDADVTLDQLRSAFNLFDLAAMHPEDLMALMEGMTGASQEELQDEFGEQFPG